MPGRDWRAHARRKLPKETSMIVNSNDFEPRHYFQDPMPELEVVKKCTAFIDDRASRVISIPDERHVTSGFIIQSCLEALLLSTPTVSRFSWQTRRLKLEMVSTKQAPESP